MKKHILAVLLSLSLLAGCTAVPSPPDSSGQAQPEPQPAQQDTTDASVVRAVPEAAGEVAIATLDEAARTSADEGYAKFAMELLRRSRQEGKNTLVSPLSVALALGMTANGAKGDTLEEFHSLYGMELDTLNAWCANTMMTYANGKGSTEITLANSLWCDPRMTLEDLFVAQCQQIYGAELYQTALADTAAVEAVNKWVSDATKGLIPEITDGFSPYSVLALINAVYLKNQFANPFETPTAVWKMDFTAADGTVSHPQGMSNGMRNELYVSDKNMQGVILPYDDGQLGFLLMLPNEGISLDDCLAEWDGSTVKEWLDTQTERLVILSIPKYEIEWSGSLADTIAAMGLTGAFSPETADFSAMGTSPNGPIFIGDVIHKTVLKVNEKGTEAAAATMASMVDGAAMPPDDLITLAFDHPFFCGIIDLETGAPLFLGTVETL